MRSKKLPIGIQSFERIITGNYVYVDKTRHIFNLIDSGEFYFLSRPRRFGKSLFISTLRCFFEGKRELFSNLWICDHINFKWRSHPVVLIDFNEITLDNPENLKTSLSGNLDFIAMQYDVKLKKVLLKDKFKELIVRLKDRYKEDAVILIDEYDKPIIEHLGRGNERLAIAKENRDIIKSFLGIIKGADVTRCLRFVFITGVSKFSQVSIFSELNNLNDITMSDKYAEILGLTDEELSINFSDRIEELSDSLKINREQATQKLRRYYDGYRFSDDDTNVYNPFSILKCFDEKKFKNYWFETGTPSFLVNLLKEKEYFLPRLENMEIRSTHFSTYEIEDLNVNAILFQTGYITIKELVDEEELIYRLGYPNTEVKKSFLEVLFYSFTQLEDSVTFLKISRCLAQGRFEEFIEVMRSLFSGIAYTLNYQLNEAHFHTMFYLMISASGIDTESEVLTSDGRIDLVVTFKDKIYIMEFKCNQSSEKAVNQIKAKRYYDRYASSGKKIFLAGINFSAKMKNIEDWKIEEISN